MSKKKEQTYIYALKDPRDNAIWYVGKSNDPRYRYHRHLFDKTSNRYKTQWMKDLLYSGHKPILMFLEKVESTFRLEAERHWIELGYRRGWPLTNIFMFEGNKGDLIVLDEVSNEIIWDYLSSDRWQMPLLD
jgi:predicted GIY-YIG superfamily endonuclease